MKTIYRLKTKAANYFFTQNADGSLNVTRWGEAFDHAGQLIHSFGGIDAMMKMAEVTDFASMDEVKAMREAMLDSERMQSSDYAQRKATEIKAAYEELLSAGVIACTAENLRKVMAFLNSQIWGSWELPAMSIGYAAHQHDCDGHLVTTVALDEAIDYRGEMVSKFKFGNAGRGHLEAFTSLGR